jgi:hypothetical protein
MTDELIKNLQNVRVNKYIKFINKQDQGQSYKI